MSWDNRTTYPSPAFLENVTVRNIYAATEALSCSCSTVTTGVEPSSSFYSTKTETRSVRAWRPLTSLASGDHSTTHNADISKKKLRFRSIVPF
jgi:hypothetical protein